MACECTNTGLDLFTVPPTQTSVEHGAWVEHHPLAVITDTGPIEFVVKGAGEEYIDLANTYLHVQAKVVKPDGGDLTEDDDSAVTPVNLFLHALFSDVDISLNGTLVSTSTNTYPFRAYIETLLNYGKESKNTQLALSMYYKNPTGSADDNDVKTSKARRERIQRSKTVDMVGRIHADLFSQDKFLLSKIDLRLRFIRSKDAFSLCTLSTDNAKEPIQYKVKILHASLFVRKVKVNPAIILAHAKVLQTSTSKYPVKRVVNKVFSVPKGNMNVVQDNLFLNQRPNKLVIAVVNSKAFNGDYRLSPFQFQHFHINSLSLYLDGQQIPTKALKPDFENGVYARSYFSLFAGTGGAWKDYGNHITYEDYKKGYTMFCFDLSPSMADGDRVELLKSGSLRLEVGFAKPLPDPVHIIVYGELDGTIEIDRARQVITDFA